MFDCDGDRDDDCDGMRELGVLALRSKMSNGFSLVLCSQCVDSDVWILRHQIFCSGDSGCDHRGTWCWRSHFGGCSEGDASRMQHDSWIKYAIQSCLSVWPPEKFAFLIHVDHFVWFHNISLKNPPCHALPNYRNQVTLCMQHGLSAADLAGTMHPYPTSAEVVRQAAQAFVRSQCLGPRDCPNILVPKVRYPVYRYNIRYISIFYHTLL